MTFPKLVPADPSPLYLGFRGHSGLLACLYARLNGDVEPNCVIVNGRNKPKPKPKPKPFLFVDAVYLLV